MTPRFNTFIFDLDGTLLDTLPDLVVNTNMALEHMGYATRSEKEILAAIGGGLPLLIRRLLPDSVADTEAEAVLACWKDIYPVHGTKLTKEYTGVTETLSVLHERGMNLGVLSNKFDRATQQLIKQFFPGVFSVVHGEGGEIPRKPDPSGLLLTLKELDAQNETAIYIGDSPGDIEVARRAGVVSAGAAWGCYGAQALLRARADYILSTPEELICLACA